VQVAEKKLLTAKCAKKSHVKDAKKICEFRENSLLEPVEWLRNKGSFDCVPLALHFAKESRFAIHRPAFR